MPSTATARLLEWAGQCAQLLNCTPPTHSMAAAAPSHAPSAPPRPRRGRPSPDGTSSAPVDADSNTAMGGTGDTDGDEAMTDDMRIAVSALGLMREGGAPPTTTLPPAGPSPSTSGTQPRHHGSASTSAPEHYALPPLPSRYRAASSSRRSDPSRSTSTASTASASEAWTGATSDTGYSSPNGSASVAGGDTDMLADNKLAPDGHGNGEHEHEHGGDPRFMARVSQLPVVSSGIEWYERSKANSRVVKVPFPLPSLSSPALAQSR